MLFKDEVRALGRVLDMPEELIHRQPFPEAGLAVRCLGEVTREKLAILGRADAIFREEVADAGLDKRIWQYFAVLTDVKTRGIRDGVPASEYALALRAVLLQGRHFRQLLPPALRSHRTCGGTRHCRGARRRPRAVRCYRQASRHDRVGISQKSRKNQCLQGFSDFAHRSLIRF